MKQEPESEKPFLDEWAEPLIFGGLAVACVLIFGQAIRFDFINLDDQQYVYQNRELLNGLNWDSIRWSFTAFYSFNWHPLTWLSHALDIQLFGLNAGAHHAVNVVFHLLNSCLVFVVLRAYTDSIWKSAFIAFLFAVHPAHVESVAWVSERKDVLSALFWLLTMLGYAQYARSEFSSSGALRRITSPPMILTIVLFALGLMAKPMLVTLPFVLLLLDYWPLDRIADRRTLVTALVEKIPMFLLAAVSSVVTYLAQVSGGSVLGLERLPISTRVVNSFAAYAKYVAMLFYPANLGAWYPFEPYFGTAEIVLSVGMFVAISALALWQIRRRPYIAVGWFWFVGTLIPVIGLVQVGSQSMADRYTYIPYLGLFVIVVWGSAELVDRFDIDNRVAAAAAAIVISVLGFAAFKQTAYWRTSETLYLHTLSVTENNYFLMNLLCRHYIDKTPTENAERRCTELLENTSNYFPAHNTIGLLRAELGRYDDAIASYKRALQVDPRAAIVYANMSVAYAKKGDTDEAEKQVRLAIDLADPNLSRDALANTYNVLGEAYAAKGESVKAKSNFETALRYQPQLEAAKQNILKLQQREQTK